MIFSVAQDGDDDEEAGTHLGTRCQLRDHMGDAISLRETSSMVCRPAISSSAVLVRLGRRSQSQTA